VPSAAKLKHGQGIPSVEAHGYFESAGRSRSPQMRIELPSKLAGAKATEATSGSPRPLRSLEQPGSKRTMVDRTDAPSAFLRIPTSASFFLAPSMVAALDAIQRPDAEPIESMRKLEDRPGTKVPRSGPVPRSAPRRSLARASLPVRITDARADAHGACEASQ